MSRPRRIAGHSHTLPGRARLAEALVAADMSDRVLVNYAALRRYSGDAWIDRYRERPRRIPLIPAQRATERRLRRLPRPVPQGVPYAH